MTLFPEDLTDDPDERDEAFEEFLELEEDKEIAEGDVSVSETSAGRHPLPDLDDRDLDEEILGEDELRVLSEDDPELGFSYDIEDAYLTARLDDDEIDEKTEPDESDEGETQT